MQALHVKGGAMYTRLVTVFVIGLLLAADAPKDEAIQKEVKKLQGTWKVVAFEVGGKVQPGPKQLVIKGEDFEGLAPNVKFRIDPSKKPKTLDLINKDDPKKVFPLIYELNGDELKIVIPLVEAGKGEEAKRPDSFQTKDKPLGLITAKREKP
jgi:uncharacterized protein (TIGR03067 family)